MLETRVRDASGGVVKSRDANGVGADVVYDELGRVTSRTDTYGNTVSSTYDRSGNLLMQTDAKGKVTSFEYDARNRLAKKTDRIGGDTIQTYDRNSNLLSLVDAEGKTTQYTYDERNQKLTEVYADHVAGTSPGQAGYGTRQFAYDDAGRLLRSTDQDGNAVTPVYDLASRVTQRDYRTLANSPSGQIQDSDTFTHDRAGRILTAHTQRYSNTVSMTWDEAGRAASESLNIGNQTYTTSRSYDNHGRLSGYTNPDGTTVARTYTSRNQLHTISYNGNVVDTRAYDIGGRITSSTYGNGVVAGYSYRDDANGKDNRLASITTTQPGGATDLVGDYSYTYDANGNKLSESITGVLASYGFTIPASGGYDDEERLTAWNRSDGNQDQSWVLSLVGDWTSYTEEGVTTPRTHSDTHEVESVGSDSVSHDLRGNLTHSGVRNHDYVWDMDNALVSADTDSNGSVDASYQYDALGRRVSKTTGGSTTVYVCSGQQVLAEYALGAAPSSPTEVYVYGSYIDEPILKDGTGGLVYYSRNIQYSVVALTNSSGSVVERYRYDAYGAVIMMNASDTEITSSAYANAYLFTGRRLDIETGLYYFRARYYDAELGRFLSRDPLGYVDGMSLYRGYMVPNGMDPLGTFVNDWWQDVVQTYGGNQTDQEETKGGLSNGTASARRRLRGNHANSGMDTMVCGDDAMRLFLFAYYYPDQFQAFVEIAGPDDMKNLTDALSWGYIIVFGQDKYWFRDWDVEGGNRIIIDADDNFAPSGNNTPEDDAIVLERALRKGKKARKAGWIRCGRPALIRPPKCLKTLSPGDIDAWHGACSCHEGVRNAGNLIDQLLEHLRDEAVKESAIQIGTCISVGALMAMANGARGGGRALANVSELRGRQLKNEFLGNKIKRFRRQMQAQGGYGNFPPIKIAVIDGKKIIIDGHHRARAAGAAGVKNVPVVIVELPPSVARKYFCEAAEAAERLGLPF